MALAGRKGKSILPKSEQFLNNGRITIADGKAHVMKTYSRVKEQRRMFISGQNLAGNIGRRNRRSDTITVQRGERTMNWIDSLGDAISYIEDNLTEELKMEDIARIANISSFYFQKSFGLLCGFTVGEYIRKRRLACAGSDVAATGEKINDKIICSAETQIFIGRWYDYGLQDCRKRCIHGIRKCQNIRLRESRGEDSCVLDRALRNRKRGKGMREIRCKYR